MGKKNTDLKFTTIKKKAKESHTKEKHELEDGSTITFYPIFPPTKIQVMFDEIKTVLTSKEEPVELNQEQTVQYILFMCIKHFTHLKTQLKASDIEGQLNEMESIIDTVVDGKSLYSLIVEDVFLPTEINRVMSMVTGILAKSLVQTDIEQEYLAKFEQLKLKNKEVFKQYATAKNKLKVENEVVN
jgi:hypothetical protein